MTTGDSSSSSDHAIATSTPLAEAIVTDVDLGETKEMRDMSNDDDNNADAESHNLMTPLMANNSSANSSVADNNATTSDHHAAPTTLFRSRKKKPNDEDSFDLRTRRRRRVVHGPLAAAKNVLRFWGCHKISCSRDKQREVCRSITAAMNVLARVVFWTSVLALVACVVWYSYELKNNGTDPHLIAWFSAGAFVLLGFPISMYGIVMHLANYNQPNVQCYIVRILWMVPIYSMESWLCLRFHRYAIYIETLRDCYEAYVLYNFLQFLIQVLGGEEELILMLKDKSPTRGVHMWGLQWCVRPWLMGQPVSRTVLSQGNSSSNSQQPQQQPQQQRSVKRVQWTSPFFVKCKFGVLQYVLLKVVSSIFVMVLELHGLYKEGDFTPKGGYLYICILTNTSQCWALYCLIFFYFATKNELGPIRPVGKFLSVKALVFFTWWQSVMISMLYQAGMVPHYNNDKNNEWTSEDVAKGLQDYLICIEMFIGAIVHIFVFPHSDYLAEAVAARLTAHRRSPHVKKRLGRNKLFTLRDDCSKSSGTGIMGDYDLVEIMPNNNNNNTLTMTASQDESDVAAEEAGRPAESSLETTTARDETTTIAENTAYGDYHADTTNSVRNSQDDDETDAEEGRFVHDSTAKRPGFVRALLDSTIPTDVMDNTVGIVKGDYHVEKKTLLHHAATYDQYDLFSGSGKSRRVLRKQGGGETTPVRKLSSQDKSEKEQQ